MSKFNPLELQNVLQGKKVLWEKTSDLSVEQLFNVLPVAIYTCNESGYITSYNNAAEKLWGRKPEIGKDLWCGSWKIFNADDEPMDLDDCPMARTLKEGIAIEGEEIIIQKPDGSKINVIPHPIPLFNDNGILVGAINTLINITEQRKEEKFHVMLSALVESAEDAIVSKTPDGIVTSWNQAAERMFGYSKEEMIGKPITILIPEDRLTDEKLILGKIRNSERVENYETVRRRKNGSLIPVSLTISPIKNFQGKVIGASKIVRDISRQKVIEEKIQRYAEKLEIVNSIDKIIYESLEVKDILQKVIDETTKLTNAEYGAFFYSKVDENGESDMLFTLSGASKESFENIDITGDTSFFKTVFKGESILRSDDITRDNHFNKKLLFNGVPAGHLSVVSCLAVPVKAKSGSVIGWLFYSHNEKGRFTEEHEHIISAIAIQTALALDNAKLYEKTLRLNSKKDEFISLASHELKTPLTSLLGYLQIIALKLPNNDTNKLYTQKAIQQGNKLNRLIADLLDISKIEAGKLSLEITSFDILELTKDVIDLMQSSFESHRIELSSASDKIIVKADQHRIEQVIINLVSNAIKYSSNADLVKVVLLTTTDTVLISVQDFGMGINKDQQEQIFSKFYRVEDGPNTISGLGIGLYISKEIIDRHNGKIWVESKFGKGSVFSFEIPIK